MGILGIIFRIFLILLILYTDIIIVHKYIFIFISDMENTLKRCRNLPKILKEKMSSIMVSERTKREGYDLGDLVHIRGKIKIFRGEREVVASYHSILLYSCGSLSLKHKTNCFIERILKYLFWYILYTCTHLYIYVVRSHTQLIVMF